MGADHGQTDSSLLIDLEAFKLHIGFKPGSELTLHFDTPSRRFYLALIALVVMAMRAPAGPKWIALAAHTDLLVALNETVGARAGSSDPSTLLRRIYRKWKTALPDLGSAPLFRVLGRQRPRSHEPGEVAFASESQCDLWANLFEYRGSEENVQLRLALERLDIGPGDVELRFGALHDEAAWSAFVASLAPAVGGAEAVVPARPTAASPPRWRTIGRRWRAWAVGSGLALTVVAGGALLFGDRRDPPQTEALDEAKVYPVPALPVIAVLPFSGLGTEERDEQLAAGFGLEIVSALSRIPDLAVVARCLGARRPHRRTARRGQRRHLAPVTSCRAAWGARATVCAYRWSCRTPLPATRCGPNASIARWASSSRSRTKSRCRW